MWKRLDGGSGDIAAESGEPARVKKPDLSAGCTGAITREKFVARPKARGKVIGSFSTPTPKPKAVAPSRLQSHGQAARNSNEVKWDPAHFRLFVGNISREVTTDMLRAAFRYNSLSQACVITDKTGKSRGYGFVAFSDPKDYLRALQEMNRKYVGNNMIQLRPSRSNVHYHNSETKSQSVDKPSIF